MAKEAIKDAAINSVGNLALDLAYQSNDLKADKGHKLICLDGGFKKGNSNCEKVAQVKVDLTTQDKKNIGNAVDIKLEEKITGGKGLTRWQKFLDFLIPIGAGLLAGSLIEYALDGDVSEFFNEIANEALTDLGIITSVKVPALPIVEDAPTRETYEVNVHDSSFSYPNIFEKELHAIFSNTGKTSSKITLDLPANILRSGHVSVIDIQHSHENVSNYVKRMDYDIRIGNDFNIGFHILENDQFEVRGEGILGVSNSNPIFIKLYRNGVLATERTHTSTGSFKVTAPLSNEKFGPILNPKRIVVQSWNPEPYSGDKGELGFSSYFNVLFVNRDSLIIKVDIPDMMGTFNVSTVNFYVKHLALSSQDLGIRLNHYLHPKVINFKPYNPELTDYSFNPVDYSRFYDGVKLGLIPPNYFPYQQVSTGQKVVINPNNVDEFLNESGDVVPVEDVEVGDPVITTDPDGNKIIVPPSEVGEPGINPIPVPENAPPESSDPPDPNDINFEKLKQIPQAFTTRFPFSLPWDVGRALSALFGVTDMNYDPCFEGLFNSELCIPQIFVDWSSFIKTVILVLFDICLIYAVSRLLGGAR